MQTVWFSLLLKLRAPNSGLGSRQDKVISTFLSGHSFLFAVRPCLERDHKKIPWKIVYKQAAAIFYYAEQGHGKQNMLETYRKDGKCQRNSKYKDIISGLFLKFAI